MAVLCPQTPFTTRHLYLDSTARPPTSRPSPSSKHHHCQAAMAFAPSREAPSPPLAATATPCHPPSTAPQFCCLLASASQDCRHVAISPRRPHLAAASAKPVAHGRLHARSSACPGPSCRRRLARRASHHVAAPLQSVVCAPPRRHRAALRHATVARPSTPLARPFAPPPRVNASHGLRDATTLRRSLVSRLVGPEQAPTHRIWSSFADPASGKRIRPPEPREPPPPAD